MSDLQSHAPTPTENDVLEWTSSEVIRRIADGSITAEGYASQLIKRHQAWKAFQVGAATEGLDAITQIDESQVLERARAVDAARQKGGPLGRLAGLPIVVKENINVAGFRTTAGTPALNDYRPARDATVVAALLKEGAIVLGKVNMDELGRGFTSSNPTYGITKNPYDVTRVPGGGAGGTAAAISARLTPAGLGSDTAGSARVPASFCGIAGFRPSTAGRPHAWTVGSWTVTTINDGVVPIAYAVTTPAPMGRTVSDVALLNSVVAAQACPERVKGSDGKPLSGVRLGVPRGFYWEDVDPEVLRIAEEARDKLREAGAVLLDVNFRKFAMAASPAFNIIARMNNLQDLATFASANANVSLDAIVKGLANPAIRSRIELSLNQPIPPDVAEATVRLRVQLAAEYEALLTKDDLAAIVYPTVPIVPPKIRAVEAITDDVDLNGRKVNQFNTSLRNTHIAGIVGSPSLVVPAGRTQDGLPVGVSFDGWLGKDRPLLSVGMTVQDVFGRIPAPQLPGGA